MDDVIISKKVAEELNSDPNWWKVSVDGELKMKCEVSKEGWLVYPETIKNTSNASSHVQVLEEENRGMVELLEGNNCNFIVKISDLHCEWEFGLPISDNYSIEHIVLAIEEKFKVERSYCKLIKSFNGK